MDSNTIPVEFWDELYKNKRIKAPLQGVGQVKALHLSYHSKSHNGRANVFRDDITSTLTPHSSRTVFFLSIHFNIIPFELSSVQV